MAEPDMTYDEHLRLQGLRDPATGIADINNKGALGAEHAETTRKMAMGDRGDTTALAAAQYDFEQDIRTMIRELRDEVKALRDEAKVRDQRARNDLVVAHKAMRRDIDEKHSELMVRLCERDDISDLGTAGPNAD